MRTNKVLRNLDTAISAELVKLAEFREVRRKAYGDGKEATIACRQCTIDLAHLLREQRAQWKAAGKLGWKGYAKAKLGTSFTSVERWLRGIAEFSSEDIRRYGFAMLDLILQVSRKSAVDRIEAEHMMRHEGATLEIIRERYGRKRCSDGRFTLNLMNGAVMKTTLAKSGKCFVGSIRQGSARFEIRLAGDELVLTVRKHDVEETAEASIRAVAR